MSRYRIFAVALSVIVGGALCNGARAQFSAQQLYVASSSGTNAYSITIPNIASLADLVGVPIRVLMSASNTSSVTLAVSGTGGSPTLIATAVEKLSPSGLLALTGSPSEIVAGQINTFMYDGTVFELLGPTLNLTAISAQNGFASPINMTLNCSAAANALTCAINANNGTTAGATPTALNPVWIPFGDAGSSGANLPYGNPVWLELTSAVSTTISGGNNMGCTINGGPCRLWLTAINDAGTVTLGLSDQVNWSTPAVYPLNESVLQSTGAGTGGGNSAGVIYTSVASLSDVAVRIIGYVEWTSIATAGDWTAPNIVRLFGPGVRKPGERFNLSWSGVITTETLFGTSDTQLTGISASITPSSAADLIEVTATLSISPGNDHAAQLGLSRGTSPTLFGVTGFVGNGSTASNNYLLSLHGFDSPATTSSTTYNVYGICSVAAGCFVNESPNPGSSDITAQEIMGALEPVNDNGKALRMVG